MLFIAFAHCKREDYTFMKNIYHLTSSLAKSAPNPVLPALYHFWSVLIFVLKMATNITSIPTSIAIAIAAFTKIKSLKENKKK